MRFLAYVAGPVKEESSRLTPDVEIEGAAAEVEPVPVPAQSRAKMRLDGTAHLLAPPLGDHNARIAQHAEVLGDVVLRHAQPHTELAHAERFRQQRPHHFPTPLITEGLEHPDA